MIYALVLTIGGMTMSDDCSKTLCFEDRAKCERMAIRLSYRSTDPEIFAYCKMKRDNVG